MLDKPLLERIPKKSEDLDVKPTKAQYLALFAIAFTLFTNSLTISYLYPFTGIMAYQFGKVDSTTGSGSYASLINMSFFVGRSTSVAQWGKFSDLKGRKMTIMICLICVFVVMFFFSFVQSYWICVIGRFILGVVSGLSPICKAALTEVLPKNRNAEAVGYASAVWYLGNFAGPFIGGNTLFLLDSYFILPSLMSCFTVFASWYLILTLFSETI